MLFKPSRILILILIVMFLFTISLARVRAQDPTTGNSGGATVAGDLVSPDLPTAITIGAVVSGILAFSPWLSDWFRSRSNRTKRIILFVLCLGAAFILLITKNPPGILSRLTWDNVLYFIQNVIAALAATQVQNGVVNTPLKKPDAGG